MAKNFQQKLDNLKTQFALAVDEYISSYPQAQQYPNVVSYLTPFRNAEQAITDANAGLFSLEGEVRADVTSLGKELKMTDQKIDQIKSANSKLSQKASDIKGADKGAEGRSTNARHTSYMAIYGSAILAIAGYFAYKTVRKA